MKQVAEQWLDVPAVSAETVYGMLKALPTETPFAIAQAAQSRFHLTDEVSDTVRRQLSAAACTERRLAQEIRLLLPDCGNFDGNTAITAVMKLHEWLKLHEQRPYPQINE